MLCTIQPGRTTSSHCGSRCTTSSLRRLSTNCTSRLRGPAFLFPYLARYPLFQIRVGRVAMMSVRLSATIPAVIDVLEDLIDVFGERGATARSVMAQLNTRFVVHLCIFKFLLKICANASAKLQVKSETLEKALQAIKTVCSWLERPRIPLADEVWEDIYRQAANIVQAADLPQHHVLRLREVHGCPAGLRSSEGFLREVFVPMCNKTLAELKRRFLSEENLAVYGGICALTPKNESFLNVEQIWSTCYFYGVQRNATSCRLRSTYYALRSRMEATIFPQT